MKLKLCVKCQNCLHQGECKKKVYSEVLIKDIICSDYKRKAGLKV